MPISEQQSWIAGVIGSASADELVTTSIGRLLVLEPAFNLWLANAGRDRLQSDEIISFLELREAKWLDIKSAWSAVQGKADLFSAELGNMANRRFAERREREVARGLLDKSTGYLDARRRLANLIDELVSLYSIVAPVEVWLPRCLLCGSRLATG
jgi:hypothetical protein